MLAHVGRKEGGSVLRLTKLCTTVAPSVKINFFEGGLFLLSLDKKSLSGGGRNFCDGFGHMLIRCLGIRRQLRRLCYDQ